MHRRPHEKKNCHSRECGNPQPIGGERKVQLIMFTYLAMLGFVPQPNLRSLGDKLLVVQHIRA